MSALPYIWSYALMNIICIVIGAYVATNGSKGSTRLIGYCAGVFSAMFFVVFMVKLGSMQ